MDSAACADYLVVSQILEYVPVSDLFNTSEVCRLWKAISLALLKRKLRYLCYCHIKSEEKCQTTASGQPKFLEDFCRDLSRFIQIAQQAECSPTFGFLSYSSNPKDEKAVVQQVQRHLSPRCVVVYHRSKTITMRPRDDPTRACSVHRGITGAFLFGPSPPGLTPCPPRTSSPPAAPGQPGSSRRSRSRRRSSRRLFPATEAPDAPEEPRYRRQCSFKRSRLEKLSKLWRRAVLRRPVEDPCLRNVAPGVMLFHSFRIPMEDGRCLTTHWRESHTGRVVAVSFMRLFQERDAAHVRSLLRSFRREFSPCRSRSRSSSNIVPRGRSSSPTSTRSSPSYGSISSRSRSSSLSRSSSSSLRDTFVIVLQNSMEDTRELQVLVELFPQVPVMSISGEFLRDEELLLMGEPLSERKVIIMVLRLLPPGAEAHVILDNKSD
ncbi:uncharacterized protein LOC144167190 [Haemaphysalis longicornis]